ALRPDGLVLDIQPEAEPERLEVVTPAGLVPVGEWGRPTFVAQAQAAQEARAALVAAGWFLAERAVTFELVHHAASVDAWLAYRAAQGPPATIAPALLERAGLALAEGGRELLIRERVTACRLRRLERF